MRSLFFRATTGHPKVAGAVMGQAANVLGPFERYVGQAIRTARQRQIRYQLPWEPVRDLLTIRLVALDTLVRIPRRGPGMVLAGWPADQTPQLENSGFVMTRHLPVRFSSAVLTVSGLVVHCDPPLLPGDQVLWCGVQSSAQPETALPAPREVADRQGGAVPFAVARDDGEYWVLALKGVRGAGELVVDGAVVEAEVLPAFDGLHEITDQDAAKLRASSAIVRVEQLPAHGTLRGNNGIRFAWKHESSRSGTWVQLLPPETSHAEDFLDPRAAFCEGDVREVWSQARHNKDTTFSVKKVDQDRYQLLLDRYPPRGTKLHLPVNLQSLYLQQRAIRQLIEAPLPHHQGLLRLCEDPDRMRWPRVEPTVVETWGALTDSSRSGTDEQRTFVTKALGTPDFAILEGPPGSGKTTAICELVEQLVAQGQRVLLCASTHVAIDNVLERLLASSSAIDAVRIGKLDRVDDQVKGTQLDERVRELVTAWRNQPAMKSYGDAELERMAERTIIMAANLTCGTTMGIVHHPLFRGRDEDVHVRERPITTMPHWDVLIIDEASKTQIQEFLVPALMARRWVIVGDVRQLPPFTDREEVIANLRDLVDAHGKAVFPADHQRACLLLSRLRRGRLRQQGMRWLIVERPGVLAWIARELEADPVADFSVVRVVAQLGAVTGLVDVVTLDELRTGAPEALRVAAADWVLVGDDLIADVAELLPSNLLLAQDLRAPSIGLEERNALLTRQAWWLSRAGHLERAYRDHRVRREDITTFADAQACEADWLQHHDLAQEIAWRITRLHELRRSRRDGERAKLRDALHDLLPVATNVDEPLSEIEDIGFPSILEVLQEGVGEDRARRRSALTAGFRPSHPREFAARFESLTYQHRMHPEISSFSREVIYEHQALEDANTIELRDGSLGWNFGPFSARRVWAHIAGREQHSENLDEIEAMASILRDFIAWARRAGRPARALPAHWEVACLCFYTKQERAIATMLAKVTGVDRKTRFPVPDAPVEVVCGTVDRFQGREADIVLLSMRNTRRVGFLDSPNRLNVAVTRARQQLVVLGNADYFARCGVYELEALAQRTPRVEDQRVRQWRNRSR